MWDGWLQILSTYLLTNMTFAKDPLPRTASKSKSSMPSFPTGPASVNSALMSISSSFPSVLDAEAAPGKAACRPGSCSLTAPCLRTGASPSLPPKCDSLLPIETQLCPENKLHKSWPRFMHLQTRTARNADLSEIQNGQTWISQPKVIVILTCPGLCNTVRKTCKPMCGICTKTGFTPLAQTHAHVCSFLAPRGRTYLKSPCILRLSSKKETFRGYCTRTKSDCIACTVRLVPTRACSHKLEESKWLSSKARKS